VIYSTIFFEAVLMEGMADRGNQVVRKDVGYFLVNHRFAIRNAQAVALLDQINGTYRRINTNELKCHENPG
jgi:hypothetical protein